MHLQRSEEEEKGWGGGGRRLARDGPMQKGLMSRRHSLFCEDPVKLPTKEERRSNIQEKSKGESPLLSQSGIKQYARTMYHPAYFLYIQTLNKGRRKGVKE